MMSRVIQQETLVFFLSILHGIGMTLFYDLLRALRRAFRHGLFAVSLEDFFFWMIAGFLTFCLEFSWTDGVIRGYVAAGIALGALFYHFTVSSLVVRGIAGLLKVNKKLFELIGNTLSKPIKITCIFLKKVIEFVRKKGYNGTKHRKSAKKDKSAERKIRGNGHGRKKKTAQQE